MNWHQKYTIDLKYTNDAILNELKSQIALIQNDSSSKYDTWVKSLTELLNRLNIRYAELQRSIDR
jgi:hypothetical protein